MTLRTHAYTEHLFINSNKGKKYECVFVLSHPWQYAMHKLYLLCKHSASLTFAPFNISFPDDRVMLEITICRSDRMFFLTGKKRWLYVVCVHEIIVHFQILEIYQIIHWIFHTSVGHHVYHCKSFWTEISVRTCILTPLRTYSILDISIAGIFHHGQSLDRCIPGGILYKLIARQVCAINYSCSKQLIASCTKAFIIRV